MADICRYSSWFHLLSLLSTLAGIERLQEDLSRNRRHSTWLYAIFHTHVYLWEESENVDGEEELDGKVLDTSCYVESRCHNT
jgi:hypothetical protein